MYPPGWATTWVAVNGRHAPILMVPRMETCTDRQSGVPGEMTWVRYRRAGSGRSSTIAGSNGAGFGVAAHNCVQSLRTRRAAHGITGVRSGAGATAVTLTSRRE
jgi:hypothetical protein